MANYEEEEEIKKLGETIERINELNERTLDAIEDAKSYAPDAADAAEDAPRALITAAPRFWTVSINVVLSHFLSKITS